MKALGHQEESHKRKQIGRPEACDTKGKACDVRDPEEHARAQVFEAVHRFLNFGNLDTQLQECLNCMEHLASFLSPDVTPKSMTSFMSSDVRVMLGAVVIFSLRDAKPPVFSSLVGAATRTVRQFRFFCAEISEVYASWDTLNLLLHTYRLAFQAFESKFTTFCRNLALCNSASHGLREVAESTMAVSNLRHESALLYRLSELTSVRFTLRDLKAIRSPSNVNHAVEGVSILVLRANPGLNKLLKVVDQYAPTGSDVRPGPLHPILDDALRMFTRSWVLATKAIAYADTIHRLTAAVRPEFPRILALVRQRGRKHASAWLWRLVVFDAILHNRNTAQLRAPHNVLPLWGELHKRIARLEEAEIAQVKFRLVCPHRAMLRARLQALKNYVRTEFGPFETFFRQRKHFSARTLMDACKLPWREAELLFSLMIPPGDTVCTSTSFLETMKSDTWWCHLWACKICLEHRMRNLNFEDDVVTQVCTITDIIRRNFPAEFLSSVIFLPFKRQPLHPEELAVLEIPTMEDTNVDLRIPHFEADEESDGSLTDSSDDSEQGGARVSLPDALARQVSKHDLDVAGRPLDPIGIGAIDPLDFFLAQHTVNLAFFVPRDYAKPTRKLDPVVIAPAQVESARAPTAQVPAKRTLSYRRIFPFARVGENMMCKGGVAG